MKLPNCENAYIPSSKLLGYLLSKTHPLGKWKARFFNTLGFDKTNTNVLKDCLLAIACSENVKDVIESAQGTKYVIDGYLQAPVGDRKRIRTVWIVDMNQNQPRFVTAYPI